jgi:hypothetical protein
MEGQSLSSRICSAVRTVSLLVVSLAFAVPAWAADVEVQLGANDGFVIKNNDGTVERLRVDEATGNISRNGALFVHTTGSVLNTFVGHNAGVASTTGGGNTAFGRVALEANTDGDSNSAFGSNALNSNVTGDRNSAFGNLALSGNVTGLGNSAFGASALFQSNASNNSAFGNSALSTNTSGYDNSAFGFRAHRNNQSGSRNSGFGAKVLSYTNGAINDNAAFGWESLRGTSDLGPAYRNSGSGNSAFGAKAMRFNTTGAFNASFGLDSMHDNTTGFRNSAFGVGALKRNTVGTYNVGVGTNALFDNTDGDQNSAFGSLAGDNITSGNGNIAIGYSALPNTTTGNFNIAIGVNAGSSQTTGSNNIYLGNVGVAGESNQIKIGAVALHTQTTLDGGQVIIPWLSTNADVRTDGSSGLIGVVSTRRYKRNLQPFEDDYAKVLELSPVTFEYLDEEGFPEGEFMGYVAEDVDEHGMPYLVRYDDQGRPANINYDQMSVYLVGLLKQHEATLAAQSQEIDVLRRTIEELVARPAAAGEGAER